MARATVDLRRGVAVAAASRKTMSEDDAAVRGIIARAKREWEGTVDALAEMVCLLDADGRIVRANRVIERWGLSKVDKAVGRTPHELVHPACRLARCPLELGIRQAWKNRFDARPPEFEYRGAGGRTVWRITLRPLARRPAAGRGARGTLAVLVVSNVSELFLAHEALARLNETLELRVRDRTRELADMNRDLYNEVARREAAELAQRESLARLERLSKELITAQEQERRRIAVELHDSVGQSLTAVKYSLERAMAMLKMQESEDAHEVMSLALGGVCQATESIRAIAMNLRPTILDDMGAASAVAWLCRQFAQVYPSMQVRTRVTAADAQVPDRLGTTIFRSAQELLNNVAKHSEAKEVQVKLERDGSQILLEVRDDGIGWRDSLLKSLQTDGRGVRNLQERAGMTGGRFTIGAATPRGTVACMSWRLMNNEVRRKGAS